MPITLGSNIAALQAMRQLGKTSEGLSRTYERLSSGMRINRASDDPAGLSVSTSLEAKARTLNQAARNVNDGISLISIAEGAMRSLGDIVLRIGELAEQAANGVYTLEQRRALDNEAQALAAEFNRILGSTSYNGQQLLSTQSVTFTIQAGSDSSAASQIGVTIDSPVTTIVGDGTFQAEQVLASPINGCAQSVGDINNDGYADIVAANGAGSAESYLGHGDGTFDAPQNFAVGLLPNRTMKLADINNDSKLDLVYTSWAAYQLGVKLGQGDGTFQAEQVYATGGGVSGGLAFADFTGDGVMDAATLDSTNNKLRILTGNSNGSFQASVSYGTGSTHANALPAVGDVTGDGVLDIIATSYGAGGARVMIGNGNGTFALGGLFTAPDSVMATALVDLNNDGRLDLIGGYWSNLGVSLGNGNGTFAASQVYGIGNRSSGQQALAYTDVNGDGLIDVISANQTSNNITIALNNGAGAFPSTAAYSQSGSPNALALGDINGDGVNDIVTGSYTTPVVSVYFADTQSQGGLGEFSLLTAPEARSALDKMKAAVGSIAARLGRLGAYQSRLELAQNNLRSTVENYRAAAGRILDADIAEESANLVRQQILQQAATAILAQANQTPALALQLLR